MFAPALACFLVGVAILGVLSVLTRTSGADTGADHALRKGLYDASNQQIGGLPTSYWFFSPLTTAYCRNRGLLPLLGIARVMSVGGLAVVVLSIVGPLAGWW